jgi:hypothetical protein
VFRAPATKHHEPVINSGISGGGDRWRHANLETSCWRSGHLMNCLMKFPISTGGDQQAT